VSAATEQSAAAESKDGGGLSTKQKVWLFVGGFLLIGILIGVLGGGGMRNEEFKPQNAFKLDPPWIPIKLGPVDLSINKAVLYLFLAAALTTWAMVYIAKRMQDKPNRVQTAVELFYSLMRDRIIRDNMDDAMAAKWFGFIGALFLFIWISNVIGYLPLPTNTEESVKVLGLEVPSFALYAATTNISIPLVLTLIVWFSYHVEGVRKHGPIAYIKTWVPPGVTGTARIPIFCIEVISHLVRIISLSVRLFANLLAGHLLILFMGGGLAVLLGIAAVAWFTMPMAVAFFIFEVGLVATLQAFIFAILTAIYLGGATAEQH